MSDEIRSDDMDGLEKKFEHMKSEGTLGKLPNLTGLPEEQRKELAKGAVEKCMQLLMKTYMSLGLNGEAVLIAEEEISDSVFELHFKAYRKGEGGN
jgi:hypothetical protein